MGVVEFVPLLGNEFSLLLHQHYIKCQCCCWMGPGRLRLMLLAPETPIRTILINQSLRDGSNLKPRSSPSTGQGSTLSPTRGDALTPINYPFITAAKDMRRPVTPPCRLPINLTTNDLLSLTGRLSERSK